VKGELGYSNRPYGFPVMTSQEVELIFDKLEKTNVKDGIVEVEYQK
jgi:hypothetical protein